MRKLIPFLAIVLMAGPAVVAFGATGTYTDDFNGTYPDNPWVTRDEGTNTEWWSPTYGGPLPGNSTVFDVSYGGMANLTDADINPAAPQFLGSILTDNNPMGPAPIVYYGGATVRATVNAAGNDVGHPQSLVAMLQSSETYNGFYTFNVNPFWHNITIGCYEISGGHTYWYRLANYTTSGGSGHPMWQIPIDLTFQAQTLPNGNVSLVGAAYGDVPDDGEGYKQICGLEAVVGVTSPDQYQIDIVNQPGGPPYDPAIVPTLTAGAVGFGAGLQPEAAGLGYLVEATVDDYASWDPIPGDCNLDGVVNLLDLGIVGDNWNGTGTGLLGGDTNLDGVVDLLDLGNVGDHWNASAFAAGAANSVPEPSTLTLLVLGAVAAVLCRRPRSSL